MPQFVAVTKVIDQENNIGAFSLFKDKEPTHQSVSPEEVANLSLKAVTVVFVKAIPSVPMVTQTQSSPSKEDKATKKSGVKTQDSIATSTS